MPTVVTKRTGQNVLLTWSYQVADEGLIDNFTIEEGLTAAGPFTSAFAVPPSAREKNFSADTVTKFYRVVAVKNGGGSTPSVGTVEVIIDNSPPAPTNLSVA